jgi:hypothetical protein
MSILTTVEAAVAAEREPDLLQAWDEAVGGGLPPGLLESTLARGPEALWRITTRWESAEALAAMRAATDTPVAVAVFRSAGAEPVVTRWDVVGSISP